MRTYLEKKVEWVDVVADDGIGKRVIKTVTREEAQENHELTWTSQAIVSIDGHVLLTLRGNGNKKYPRKWEIGITETPRSGESDEEATEYGLEEELLIPRIEQGSKTHLFDNYYRHPTDESNKKNVAVFYYVHHGKIRYDSNEIAAALLLRSKDIKWAIATGTLQFTPMNIRTYEMLMERGLLK